MRVPNLVSSNAAGAWRLMREAIWKGLDQSKPHWHQSGRETISQNDVGAVQTCSSQRETGKPIAPISLRGLGLTQFGLQDVQYFGAGLAVAIG